MAAQSGGIQPLYGVIIHDKCKTADLSTLKAAVEKLLAGEATGEIRVEATSALRQLNARSKAVSR